MRPRARIVAAALAVSAAACEEERLRPLPHRAQPPPSRADVAAPSRFTLRDLALATAVDARAARLSAVASELEAALLARGEKDRARARDLVPVLESARAELDHAARAVQNPLDRALAGDLAARASRYAVALSGAAASGTPDASLALARRDLGEAIARYRDARAGWRLDAPDPRGAEREFALARRELERAEGALVARAAVAPGAVDEAVRRARSAAGRLPPTLAAPAARYVVAQADVLAAAAALARSSEGAKEARAYQRAKAEALSALADYFAAAASR